MVEAGTCGIWGGGGTRKEGGRGKGEGQTKRVWWGLGSNKRWPCRRETAQFQLVCGGDRVKDTPAALPSPKTLFSGV